MDLGPMSAISPVRMIHPAPVAPDLARVLETENRGQSGDDEYTPANRKASRGLEDEEDDLAEDPADAETQPEGAADSSQVNFFA